MEPKFTMTAFTPAEAASITGVSTALQRDWRRHDYLPSGEGHARFDAFDLARMLVMKLLADRGIGPSQTFEIAEWCALGIMIAAVADVDAWEGDDLWKAPIDPPVGDERFLDALKHLSGSSLRVALDAEIEAEWWGRLSRYLMNSLWRKLGKPRIQPGSYFIWWPTGEHHFGVSLDDAFSSRLGTPGAAIVLDFHPIARALMDRAGRGLCHVEFDDPE